MVAPPEINFKRTPVTLIIAAVAVALLTVYLAWRLRRPRRLAPYLLGGAADQLPEPAVGSPAAEYDLS